VLSTGRSGGGEPPAAVIDVGGVDALIAALRRREFDVIGPVRREAAICYGPIESVADLPVGWGDAQEGGEYRLIRRSDRALFGYAVGPDSLKRYLLPPSAVLFTAERSGDGAFSFSEPEGGHGSYAFLAARPCELAAIAIQDRVLLGGSRPDSLYARNRAGAFIVAVQCAAPGGTCFCDSMGTGPRAASGFDLALTEILDGEHRFVVEVGSDAGADVIAEVPSRAAAPADLEAAAAVTTGCRAGMGRRLDTEGLHDDLLANLEHPRWDEVAARCLSCGNCTMACPTCFCTAVVDATDLAGRTASRSRQWDSCFAVGFSYIHGGPIRPGVRARYRQWLTHKLATWIDQFGTSGCVGCGRCITWCPVGIDITEEAAAIREPASEQRHVAGR
jgi:sulfhydrogenase subunit beta (sulfur reductase)